MEGHHEDDRSEDDPDLNRRDSDSPQRDGFLQTDGVASRRRSPDGQDPVSQSNAQTEGGHHENDPARTPQPAKDDPVDANGDQTGEDGREKHRREDVEPQIDIEYHGQINADHGIFHLGKIGEFEQVVDEGETEGDQTQLGCSNDAVDDDLRKWHGFCSLVSRE